MHCIEQDSLSRRRSIYSLGRSLSISDNCLYDTISECLLQCPTPFNVQSARLVILYHEAHHHFWNLVFNSLQKTVAQSKIPVLREKISSFAAAYGTVLFFEEKKSLQKLKKDYPLYRKNMKIWTAQANGMLQYMIWQTLAENEVGASLQHYSELVEKDVIKWLGLPKTWELVAQMPFGSIEKAAAAKSFLPLSKRLFVYEK